MKKGQLSTYVISYQQIYKFSKRKYSIFITHFYEKLANPKIVFCKKFITIMEISSWNFEMARNLNSNPFKHQILGLINLSFLLNLDMQRNSF